MCYNLTASICAFLIGTTSGLYLLSKQNNDLKIIGFFVLVITMIQLIEACIYYFKNKHSKFFTRILSLLLGFQGLSIILATYYFTNKINYYWFGLFITIFLIILFSTLSSSFKTSNNYKYMNWDFLNKNKMISNSLFAMYISLFIWGFSNDSKKINNYFVTLFITCIYSYLISSHKNSPSLWCLTSVVSTPIFILYNQLNK